ncbi:MAG TPA: TetR/AcrR family transcriptional regulator [Gemmatimonadaceae bacterium]|jgi:AcrR family transcriptional regulator|nr:TetR/AcrR family transcriptional regulator [Gemmatimonadaceae bacterium]
MGTTGTAREPRWRRLPAQRPQQILDAAFEAFTEHGLASARLDDIARRAGVSKGTIYLYFPSKEDLFREVVRHTVGDAIDDFARRLKGPTALADLNAFIDAKWAFHCSPKFPSLYRWVNAELQSYPELERFYAEEIIAKGRRLLRGILERGMAAGEFRRMDPAMASRMLIAMLSAYGNWRHRPALCESIGNRSDAQLLEEIRDFYLNAIRPASVPARDHHSLVS